MANRLSQYKVFPLPVVQKWARKRLSVVQLREGIKLARRLRFYPDVPDLHIERCGDGMELRIERPSIGKTGWLRAIFWIDEKAKLFMSLIYSGKRATPSQLRTACVPTNGFGD